MRLIVLILCILAGLPAYAADGVGFRQMRLAAGERGRPLEIAIWYPATAGGTRTLIGDNPAFIGQALQLDAPASSGRHPLVVLSHGYGGNWTNQGWLAPELARHGYVVAAVNHPGTTSRDMDTARGAMLWERPRDLSRVIDLLTTDPAWSGMVADDGVAVVGHSLGGWTAIAIAGGRFDADLLEADCAGHPQLAACSVYRELGAGRDAMSRAALGQSLADPRVKAVVSLDLGLARGFTPASLARIEVPVLVIAAGHPDPLVPAEFESRFLIEHLPAASAQHAQIATATHFSFLPLCKPGAAQLLEQDTPGDGVVCQDGQEGARPAIHEEAADLVVQFLAATLPAR